MNTSYKNLIVWRNSIVVTLLIYKVTVMYPKNEQYVLVSQMRRAAVSIASNIAEGSRRRSKKERIGFLRIAFGSGAELETQLLISRELSFINSNDYHKIINQLEEVMKMLNVMCR